ncbi:hypothetical protein MNBD_PLANCTO03-2039, partial [hydrothermal vent metagenome]
PWDRLPAGAHRLEGGPTGGGVKPDSCTPLSCGVKTAALTLAIEVSNPSAAHEGSGPGVTVGRVGSDHIEVLGVEMLRSKRRHDDDLMPAIERLWSQLASAGLIGDKREIDRVAVSVGPGGFTGLRVAVVAGKMIAEVTGALCVGVPSACVVARRAGSDLPTPFGVALASKKESSVVMVFDGPTQVVRLSEPGGAHEYGHVIEADTLEALGVRGLIADRFLPESMRTRCSELGIRIDEPVFDPVACLEASAAFKEVAPIELVPMYGREPEAVRKWRELHG